MFLLEGRLIWTASDLTAAAECEYALLRTIDYRLGWAEKPDVPDDPLQEQIARLGDRHEQRVLEMQQALGSVVALPRVPTPYSTAALKAADEATQAAFRERPTVVYQAGFYDGEFHGYADFVELAEDGWIVSDAKLARSAKPKALLQLGAYAVQLQRMRLPVSNKVSLLLGSGERADFPIDDVLPVFRERRERLRRILLEHRGGGVPVTWGDERYTACGRCDECEAAAEQADDLLLVAGLTMIQRRKLRAAGVTTIGELAAAGAEPAGMAQPTFEKLKAQARLQWTQMQAGPDATVTAELTPTADETLSRLPAPSDGDLFFDFEGDPLYDEGNPKRSGLEYLWGIMDIAERYEFAPRWAHTWQEERAAFVAFMEFIAARRVRYPDMHIYHYAPYEMTALKRMTMTYEVKQAELDVLLREEVFVDLYATVRGAIRISASSYSIKKLEPLYMGSELRNEDGVTSGGASILAYQQYRELKESDPAAAQQRLDDLEDYNRYDCLSTLRLRAWLMERARDAGVIDQIKPRSKAMATDATAEADPQIAQARRDLTQRLLSLAGTGTQETRTAEQQGFAMLASALNYHRMECNVFWWDHFDRLQHPIDEWADTRDVFVIDQAIVEQEWFHPGGRARNHRRTLRLVGDWAPGSHPGSKAFAVYSNPGPLGSFGPDAAPYSAAEAEEVEESPDDPRIVRLTESRKPTETFSELPTALTPGKPPPTKTLEAAIEQVATEAATAGVIPNRAIFDLLLRRLPRVGTAGLPRVSGRVPDIVAALLAMQNSYLAIQGPPGTGKTYTGSRVIRKLVEQHHWRIGVVGQSHAVVENMLAGVVDSGLDALLVGKSKPRASDRRWTEIKDDERSRALFLQQHQSTGCVLGGTAWTFAHPGLLATGQLDLLVVDEAGQFSLASTVAASVAAQRLLLLGDPQQLPQVSQATHADAVDESALGWLMQGHDTLPPKFGYFLADSYRMHPTLCSKVSALSYERRLKVAADAEQRDLEGVAPGLSVVLVEHTGNRTESIEEARAVVEQIQSLLGKRWQESQNVVARPLEGKDFLVVAPYNAQVALLGEQLLATGLSDVRVGTVDKFQGQEAPIAIVSMTASSHGDVPRGMAFLLNRNRVNVAVSRAKWRAIVVRSANLTAYMPSSPAQLLELGAFIGLCEAVG
jgi:uncharacterized protein